MKNVKGYQKYHPILFLRQMNFVTEKDSALSVIKRIGLDRPFKKWNNLSLIDNKKRIYILSNEDATFQDYDEKYSFY